jgi:nucleoside phosphorylase
MSARRSLPIDQYQVGVICALPHEMTAVTAMLDEEDEPLKTKDAQDSNTYALGRMGQHNVVIACLPAGVYGTTAAASVAKDMLRTCSGLRFGLMVGIGGGIHNTQAGRDIRLGDIVVSQPDGTFGGVVQYDVGKNLGEGRFVRKGSLDRPPTLLLTALSSLQSKSGLRKSQIPKHLTEMNQKHTSLKDEGFTFPGVRMDYLHCSTCNPTRWWWRFWLLLLWLCPLLRCERCENGKVLRASRTHENPVAHYGTIASGNQVVKDATVRDQLGREFNALCVEMEAAGLMNDFPCIVIRGICDYADSHKNDGWQKYAAITAAAYAKELLAHISPEQTSLEKPIQEVVGK